MPVLHNINFEGGTVCLLPPGFEPTHSSANVFTVVVGKNGEGKSRLLAAIAKELTRETYLFGALRAASDEPRVIAASTSPFDKFPAIRKWKDAETTTNYRYVGIKGDGLYNSSSSVSLISSAAKGLLEKIITRKDLSQLRDVFNSLNFSPEVEFVFKPSYLKSSAAHREYVNADTLIGFEHDLDRLNALYGVELESRFISILKRMQNSQREQVFWALETLGKNGFQKKAASFVFNFSTLDYEIKGHLHDKRIIESIFILLSFGLIRLMDLRLIKDYYGPMSLRKASSGEQCMIVLMLGIAGHICNDSLVLIDEPEISLHPEWQESFMKLLSQAFSNYSGCHFIIATHSPQIVSRLTNRYCFVTSLTKRRVYDAASFSNRSADYQLAELFETPGTKNEYISRLAFNLLAKIKSRKILEPDDVTALNHLMSLGNNIAANDPLKDLILSVKEVCKRYADNSKFD